MQTNAAGRHGAIVSSLTVSLHVRSGNNRAYRLSDERMSPPAPRTPHAPAADAATHLAEGVGARQPEPADDLAELPPPRRPFRRITLVVMAITALFSASLLVGIAGELAYSLASGRPTDIGELTRANLDRLGANTWVRAAGELSPTDVIGYRRPLETDVYRLARVEGSDRVWVELRVPRGAEGEHFIAPSSFVGRLMPVSAAGLRYGALPDALVDAGKPPLPDDAWLLIDGEAPAGTRWALGLAALLLGFAAFNLFGLIRLSQRVRDA